MTITGGCLCGALRYRAEGAPNLQGLCHCRTCQRLSGAGHTGFITFAESAVMLQGDTASYSSTGGSGRTATRSPAKPRIHAPTAHGAAGTPMSSGPANAGVARLP